ncbi:MAG: hypothetical protein GXP24_12510 [Planctomycetes bacterium]|nr:hypothetical protein [Planctomycetota bacterium]
MCRRTTAKLAIFFTVTCLLMVAANEVFAISQGSVVDVFSALDYEEMVERDGFAAKQLPSCQAALDFEPAFCYILADFLSSAPHSHVIHDVQSRGPPTSWL